MTESSIKKSGFVTLMGRPNSGKSTLMNRVLGSYLSIVTHKAQTTRFNTLGILNNTQGQMIFVDTPGIHLAKEGGLNAAMMEQAKEALQAPHVVWYLVDPTSKAEPEQRVLDFFKFIPKDAAIFVLMNKKDLGFDPSWVKRLPWGDRIPNLIWDISAETGEGVEELLEATWQRLPEGQPFYPDEDQISDRPTRFFIGEMIREQVLKQLAEEIPYSCAIEVGKIEENAKPYRIEATIHVERESQKGIVIGVGGRQIKKLGTESRKQIETFLGQPVFLNLQVKIKKDWSKNPKQLKQMGFTLPS